jgi:hypothetical protein
VTSHLFDSEAPAELAGRTAFVPDRPGIARKMEAAACELAIRKFFKDLMAQRYRRI